MLWVGGERRERDRERETGTKRWINRQIDR